MRLFEALGLASQIWNALQVLFRLKAGLLISLLVQKEDPDAFRLGDGCGALAIGGVVLHYEEIGEVLDPLGRVLGKVEDQLDCAIVEGDYCKDHKRCKSYGVVHEDQIHQLCIWDVIGGQFAQITSNFDNFKEKVRNYHETENVRKLANYASPVHMRLLLFNCFGIVCPKLDC